MKNITLIIPTHGRVGKQITLAALPVKLQSEVILVASLVEEAKQLRTLYPKNEVVVAKGTKSIAQKRHWIMQNIEGKMLFMMDDDIAFFERCPPAWRVWEEHRKAYALAPGAPDGAALMKRLYPADKRLLELFQDMDTHVAKTKNLAMIGIAHRRHSDKKKDSWEVNSRMMYAFGVDKNLYNGLKIRFDAVGLREDFHVVLSMLRKGRECHNYLELLNNEYGTFGAAGGCSGERSMDYSNEQCFALQKLHPAFVKVVDRQYTTTTSRKEVVIAWKKAFESSNAATK
jgi:hypothetical protein